MPPDVATKLRTYGVEDMSDLGEMEVKDYDASGLTLAQGEVRKNNRAKKIFLCGIFIFSSSK
jgi:hypothetical protein